MRCSICARLYHLRLHVEVQMMNHRRLWCIVREEGTVREKKAFLYSGILFFSMEDPSIKGGPFNNLKWYNLGRGLPPHLLFVRTKATIQWPIGWDMVLLTSHWRADSWLYKLRQGDGSSTVFNQFKDFHPWVATSMDPSPAAALNTFCI